MLTYSDDVLKKEVIRYRKGQKWKGIDEELTLRYGHEYIKEIGMINSLVASGRRYGLKGSEISLDQNSYTQANKITKQGISYTKTKRLLTQMDADNLITLYIGYWDAQDESGVSSFFIVNPEYEDMWAGVDVSCAMKKEEDTIVIRDSKTKISLPTRSFRGVKLLREDLDKYNKLLSKHTVLVGDEVVDVSYKRVFHDNLKGSGRYYSNNSFQTIEKEVRTDIKIDGAQTIELDYSAIHPRILYSLEGIRLDKAWSPYAAPINVERDILKVSLLILFYSKNRQSAIHEIWTKMKLQYADAEKIVKALEEHNKSISQYFYQKDMWKALQHYDSLIASEVLSMCIHRNIIALPYHDSFRVEEGYKEILMGVMYESWRRVVGDTGNCVVECKLA